MLENRFSMGYASATFGIVMLAMKICDFHKVTIEFLLYDIEYLIHLLFSLLNFIPFFKYRLDRFQKNVLGGCLFIFFKVKLFNDIYFLGFY